MAGPSNLNDSAVVRRPFGFFRGGGGGSGGGRAVLVMEDVYKYHRRDIPTLRGVNLRVERGEFVFVTGPSGAGKSTLLQLIYRGQMVDAGRILFCSRDISRLCERSVPFLRRNLGVVFQDFKVIPHWSVFENVAICLEIISMPPRIVRARVSEALERVGLAGRGDEPTANLSGGEQQRVAVARAIVTEPALILADEPTGNLDPQLAIDILTLLEEINQAGATVIFATHDHSLMQASPHRTMVLDQGRVIEARFGLRSASAAQQSGLEVERPLDEQVDVEIEHDPKPPPGVTAHSGIATQQQELGA
ncbi:MAG: ATP-binding cassette domain-containing protein [Proteobacteria bacterium]|nr:ATP-binding cassette domain-containing protein [Pseudomonadota bacterium]